jgi:putative FmdB family regulatory protein
VRGGVAPAPRRLASAGMAARLVSGIISCLLSKGLRGPNTAKKDEAMPIYEYRCAACGHDVEALQKFSDAPLTVCPECQKPELRKRVSAAGFQLKGSGWYVTDFRGGGKPPARDKTAGANGNGAAKAPETPSGNAKAGDAAPATAQPAAASYSRAGAATSGDKASSDKTGND